MIVALAQLWLPIVLSAVFVFIVSSLFHMVIPIHKGDFRKMPGEERILAEMRAQGLQPGSYNFPMCESMKDMGSPEMTAKANLGPVGFVTVIPNGPCNIGKNLLQWFIYCLLVGVLVAYVAGLVFPRGAAFMPIFRVAGTAAILGYALGTIPESIWRGQMWSISMKFVFDGLVYGLVTGATFAWLWPAA